MGEHANHAVFIFDEVGEHANHAVFISNGKIVFANKIKSKKDLVNRYKKLIIKK